MKRAFPSCKATYFFPILALTLLACGREKDTFGARLYHNTTSFFNGYYNAHFLFDETVARLESQYKLPDQGFIEVDYFGTEQEAKSFDADFETVIKKNDAVMYKHPKGNWIDDCRILNGKSWLFRQNYSLALQNFAFVAENFPQSKRLPEAWLWTAITHYRMENPVMSRDLLKEYLPEDYPPEMEDEVKVQLALFRVRLFLDQKNYADAERVLSAHLDLIPERRRRAKAHFLLGQLYGEMGSFGRAIEQYALVERYSDDYALTFGGKIRTARLYLNLQRGQAGDEELVKYLNRLLRDEKNLEYRDQIYYEFALLELKNQRRDPALDYLRQSLRVSAGNQRQKALSYFKAGQIYFYDLQDFDKAQAYYDSAAAAIIPTAPEYREITNLASALKDYIRCRQTIAYQDSMLRLAALPKEQVDAIVEAIVAAEKKKQEEEAARLLKEMENQQASAFFNPELELQQGRRPSQGGAVWYFDDPASVSEGRLKFQQVWGNRANQDNWRRSKTASLAARETDPALAQGSPKQAAQQAPRDTALARQYGDKYRYYQDIPQTEEARAAAHAKIERALFDLGQVFAQKLEEPDSAQQTLELLLRRYPDGANHLPARYALYQLYTAAGKPAAEGHKDFILSQHPETVYAYLILGRDPKELRRDEEDYRFVYEALLRAYSSREYETAIGFSEYLLGLARYGDNEKLDLAELQFIRGMSYGYAGNRDSLRNILTLVVQKYPESDVKEPAQRILGFLTNGLPASPDAPAAAPASKPAGAAAFDPTEPRFQGFSQQPRPGDKVFVLLLVDKDRLSKETATSVLSDFNQKRYASLGLKVFTFQYKEDYLLPYISSFSSVEEARQYVSALQGDAAAKTLMPAPEDRAFYITHSNFRIAYGQKRMEDYLEYYDNAIE
jgi:TolA-binding protein